MTEQNVTCERCGKSVDTDYAAKCDMCEKLICFDCYYWADQIMGVFNAYESTWGPQPEERAQLEADLTYDAEHGGNGIFCGECFMYYAEPA